MKVRAMQAHARERAVFGRVAANRALLHVVAGYDVQRRVQFIIRIARSAGTADLADEIARAVFGADANQPPACALDAAFAEGQTLGGVV